MLKTILAVLAVLLTPPLYAAQQIIGVGASPNDGTGDTLKSAFTKVNENFTELYGMSGSSLNGLTVTSTTGGVLTIGNGKTFTLSNSLTLAGTDGSTLNIGAGGTLGTAAFTAATAYQAASGGALTISSGKTLTSSNTLTLAGTDGSTLNIGAGGTLGSAAYTASSAYQSLDSDLTSLAAASSTNSLYYRSGAGTWAPVTLGSGVTLTSGQLDVSGGGGGHPLNGRIEKTTVNDGPLQYLYRADSPTFPLVPFTIYNSAGTPFTGDGQTKYDPQFNLGFFGSGTQGGIIMEQGYWSLDDHWQYVFELHNVFIDSGGNQFRPITWNARYDDSYIRVTISGDRVVIMNADSSDTKFGFDIDSSNLLFDNELTTRVGAGAVGSVQLGSNLSWDPTDSRYEAVVLDKVAGVVAGAGAVGLYAPSGNQAAGSAQTPGFLLQNNNATLTGNLTINGGIRIGSNLLEINQIGDTSTLEVPLNWKVSAFAAFGGAAIDGGVIVGATALANDDRCILLRPFSGGQTADLFTAKSNADASKFAVLAGGTPISEDAAQGYVIRSSNGHYWRVTVSDAGTLTTADLGTSRPTN